jgi:SAM-dependent methyltransferase
VPYRADVYDVVTPSSFRGDVEWYRRKASESGGPVLELGAGTGRVTLAIARAGVTVHALDADQGMLDRLQAKLADESDAVRARVVVIRGDMRTFELRDRFALVIAPFRAFLHNLTDADRFACLQRVHAHLRPGGAFAMNVFHPSLEYMAQNTGALAGVWRAAATVALADGGWLVRSESNRYDTMNQRVESLHRYDEYAPDGTLSRSSLHRLDLAYLYPADIRHLLMKAGFVSVEIAGGFDGRVLHRDTDELVVEARAVGAPPAI